MWSLYKGRPIRTKFSVF